jgi:4-hydroxy-tetrahydrodipicolinate reductase
VIGVCVPGARGRMGQRVIELLGARADELRLVAAVERPGHADLGRDVAGGVPLTDDLAAGIARADVYIDFTVPSATAAAARAAAAAKTAAVIGTTGLDRAAEDAIAALAARAPVVAAPNFSLGVNLLLALAENAARALGPEFDLEVVDLHHRDKRDAPSGTAIALADALARGRGLRLADVKRYAREGDIGPRPDGEIGVSTLRGGDAVGEHTALFLGPGERLELCHKAGSRAIFAAGALRAAAWVKGRAPGRYSMRDVLGL